ncbi:CBO0543 family protein [Oceanobacillus sp. FSL W7-1293]|uniref:CBO0543 family protein n=1 Tax=Oceanobacillus sp. FSL W7-1293 TaxID=2921699 RepID=UPI0030CD7DA2
MQSARSEVVELLQQYRELRTEYWLHENLFTISWWILFVTTVGIFIVWFIILDKKRIFEIVTYGFFVTAVGVIGDAIGVSLMLWHYPNTLLPVSQIAEVHTIQMPIIYMLVYQYFHSWKSFIIASAINAFVFAFMLEPLLVWLQIYELHGWKHIYSFFPYILIAVVFKLVVNKFKKLDRYYES